MKKTKEEEKREKKEKTRKREGGKKSHSGFHETVLKTSGTKFLNVKFHLNI